MAERIRTALDGIATAWSDTLEPARRETGSHATGSLVNPPLPVPADVLDQRAKAHERLAWWSRKVITGRKLNRLPAIDVEALCKLLDTHADWLATSEHGGKARAELENSAAALGVIAAQNAPKRFVVSKCPVVDCAGLLRVTLRRDDDAFPSVIKCTLDDEHKWSPSMWKYIARVGQ